MASADECGRQLFTRLHDGVGIAASWQGSWEALDKLSPHIGVSYVKAKTDATKLSRTIALDREVSDNVMVKMQNSGSILFGPTCFGLLPERGVWIMPDILQGGRAFYPTNELMSEVMKTMRDYFEETGRSKLFQAFSASFSAGGPNEPIDRGKPIMRMRE